MSPRTVVLKPEIQPTTDSIGQGRSVLLTVVDERQSSSVDTYANVTLQGNLVSIVKAAIADGLMSNGFVIASNKPPDGRELRVEVRYLNYRATSGLWAIGLQTECSLKGICIIGSSRLYEQLYRGEHRWNVQVAQSAEAIGKNLSIALSEAINSLLRDYQMKQCLAK